MDNRFSNIFGLTEDRALELLQTPVDELEAPTEHYVAVSHLVNFPTERSIAALVEAIQSQNSDLYGRITRRKAVESLGKLKAETSLPVICSCLEDEDLYTVENAVWAIGEIGTGSQSVLDSICRLLQNPEQNHRTIIQVLAKLEYRGAVPHIEPFITAEKAPVRTAALSALCQLENNPERAQAIVPCLQDTDVTARRSAIQDLVDAKFYPAIPDIVRCPVSFTFRLRGIRLLAEEGYAQGALNFKDIEPHLDCVIRDRPQDLEFVHEYDKQPTLDFLVSNLYHTDFGVCYLATQNLLEHYPAETPAALRQAWSEEAHNDYGAHYHVIKLYGWLKDSDAYDTIVEALNNTSPQFQKSRAGAAIALGELGDARAIDELKQALSSRVFSLQYAAILALGQLGVRPVATDLPDDRDWILRAKAAI